MPRNAIYRADYSYAGYNYRLEIIPTDSTDLNSPEIIELNPSSLIKVDNQNSKFGNKLPVGLISANSLKITFDLLFCPDDLVDYLAQPFIATTKTIQVNPAGQSTVNKTKEIELSNLFILKQYDGSQYNTVFVGSQKKTVKRKYNIDRQVVSAEYEVIDIGHVIYTHILPEDIKSALISNVQASNYEVFYDELAYEHLWAGQNGWTYGVADGYKNPETGIYDIKLAFFKLKELFDQIHIIADKILKLYYRQSASVEVSGNILSGIGYYSQNTSDDQHAKGVLVSYDNLMYIAAYTKTTDTSQVLSNPMGGFLIDSDNDVDNLYKYDTAWDFIKAMSEAKFVKVVISYSESGIKLNHMRLGERDSNNVVINPVHTEALGTKTVYEEGADIIRSMKFNVNSTDRDDDSFSYENAGSMSDQDYEVKSVFHNMPTVPGGGKYTIKTDGLINPAFRLGVFVTQSINVLKLYYKHTALENIAIKVHESVMINDGIDAKVYDNELAYRYIPQNLISVKSIIYPFQITMTEFIALAHHYGELFGRYNQSLWEAEFPFDAPEYTAIKSSHIGDTIEFNNRIDFLTSSALYPYAFKQVYRVFSKNLSGDYRKGVVVETTANYSKATTKAKILILGE